MRHRTSAILLTAMLASPAGAGERAMETPCSISAYVTDRDPHGLNVRAGPSTRAAVLRVVSNAGSGVAAVRARRGGWFRVAAIVDAESEAELFRGDGWVHRSLLHLDGTAADPRLYAAPRRDARVLARVDPDEADLVLIGCSGAWAQVHVRGRTGWLSPDGQCSNPLTTCA
ncbi:MAG TPA: SH3 domain-containing protein [Allosphingosinicella sp.]|jgi:SH3-like domain-containing protein|nr:SH3 domain-containing protein [Allosphingosinicella sp.]